MCISTQYIMKFLSRQKYNLANLYMFILISFNGKLLKTLNLTRKTSVSYTHLDVYKRQSEGRDKHCQIH